jgi:hypothetical protein
MSVIADSFGHVLIDILSYVFLFSFIILIISLPFVGKSERILILIDLFVAPFGLLISLFKKKPKK